MIQTALFQGALDEGICSDYTSENMKIIQIINKANDIHNHNNEIHKHVMRFTIEFVV